MTCIGRIAFAFLAIAYFGSAASAADLPIKMPGMAPAAAYNWHGCYVGIHMGGCWSRKDFVEQGTTEGSHNGAGALGGGQVGCNWHLNSTWVWGVEGQFSAAGIDGSHITPDPELMKSRISFLGTFAGRVGYAWGNHLAYIKGGAAWVAEKFDEDAAIARDDRIGWMLGAGLEYGFAPNWSAKVEYNYLDFGDKPVTFTGGNVVRVDQRVHLVKVGVNYRWSVDAWGAR